MQDARRALERGEVTQLGALMSANQGFLRRLDVSSPVLETLVEAALSAGASGAKLSGGGRGGNVIAVARREQTEGIREALLGAGAVNAVVTRVG